MNVKRVHWSVYFLLWLLGVSALGAVIGAVIFGISGALFSEDRTAASLAIEGARRIGFIFSIWAPAIALVATVMRAHARRQRSTAERE